MTIHYSVLHTCLSLGFLDWLFFCRQTRVDFPRGGFTCFYYRTVARFCPPSTLPSTAGLPFHSVRCCGQEKLHNLIFQMAFTQ